MVSRVQWTEIKKMVALIAVIARMNSELNLRPGERVLEIGTGSGDQAAYLSCLTDKVFTVEVVQVLHERAKGVLDGLSARGYEPYKAIQLKHGIGRAKVVQQP